MSEVNPPEPTFLNGGATSAASGGAADDSLAAGHSKRQRRPNVRLGEIGDQPAAITHEPHLKRIKPWKHSFGASFSGDHYHRSASKAPSKARNVAALGPGDGPAATDDRSLVPFDENLEPLAASIRRTRDAKPRRTPGGSSGGVAMAVAGRRVRTNWNLSKNGEGFDGVSHAEVKSSDGEDAGDDGYRDFDGLRAEDSESPSDRRAPLAARVRAPETGDILLGHATDAVEEDVPSEVNGSGDWDGHNGRCTPPDNGGVRSWLNRLGLSRYAPVFVIHEVDDEVLPMLTLEDLKDMGINAVGSRRKMYCAIQKLKKGFS